MEDASECLESLIQNALDEWVSTDDMTIQALKSHTRRLKHLREDAWLMDPMPDLHQASFSLPDEAGSLKSRP